jgi:hypothetical protein
MANQQIFKSLRGTITATAIAVSSMMTIASTATAATLQVSVENLGPNGGSLVTPLWVAFQDGSFDTFDVGVPASSGIEYMAEDGVSGIDSKIFGESDFLNNVLYGAIPQKSTIGGLFAESSAAKNGGTQDIVFPNPADWLYNAPVIFPGGVATKTIELNGDTANHRYFSYASYVFPSNDAFISNEKPIEIFDANGKFIGADLIILGNQVWDAGTEVNDENRANVGFPSETGVDFNVLGRGIPENGTVQPHPGFKNLGAGGFFDYTLGGNQLFANADFKASGYQVARIKITEVTKSVPEPSTTGAIAFAGLLILLPQVRRSMKRNPHLNLTHS